VGTLAEPSHRDHDPKGEEEMRENWARAVLLGLLSMVVASATILASEGSLEGVLRYDSGDPEYPPFELQLVDGIAWEKERNAEERARDAYQRVEVVLLTQAIDHDELLAVLAEKGVVMFAMTKLGISEYVKIDICRLWDGSEAQFCGYHFSGPAVSSSQSGVGNAFSELTESVSFTDDRVSAVVRTVEPVVSFASKLEFAISFDLPIRRPGND
jgi:hypothetical protein